MTRAYKNKKTDNTLSSMQISTAQSFILCHTEFNFRMSEVVVNCQTFQPEDDLWSKIQRRTHSRATVPTAVLDHHLVSLQQVWGCGLLFCSEICRRTRTNSWNCGNHAPNGSESSDNWMQYPNTPDSKYRQFHHKIENQGQKGTSTINMAM